MSSTVKRGSSPPPTGVGKKHHLAQNNGSGPPPLSYPLEPADDVNMNEVLDEKVEIEFIQPNGKTTHISIDSRCVDFLVSFTRSLYSKHTYIVRLVVVLSLSVLRSVQCSISIISVFGQRFYYYMQ